MTDEEQADGGHEDDPRQKGVAEGGYPEEQPGAGERRPRPPGEDRSDDTPESDPARATGNPLAAGGDPDQAAEHERG